MVFRLVDLDYGVCGVHVFHCSMIRMPAGVGVSPAVGRGGATRRLAGVVDGRAMMGVSLKRDDNDGNVREVMDYGEDEVQDLGYGFGLSG